MSIVPSSSTPQPQKTDAAIHTRKVMDFPLNFSFFQFVEPSELEGEEPRELMGGKKVPKNDDDKYVTKCLRLNNNQFQELKGFTDIITKLVAEPSAISWIDFSFNELHKIDPVFCDFPNLQILYLHGNSINDVKEVDKLAGAPCLKKLSLHGNPIESVKNYRWYVLSNVCQLISFDMSAVTKADRATAATWSKGYKEKKTKRRRDDD